MHQAISAGAEGRPPGRMRRFVLPAVALLIGASLEASPGGPRRVLVLSSYGRDFSPYASIESTFRTELAQLSPSPVEFLEVSLETVNSETPEETPIVDYIRALCERRTFDLVAPIGAPAARFWLRHRDRLLPAVPSLLIAVEERHLKDTPIPSDVTAVRVRIDAERDIRHILQVLPKTRNVVVIIGDSPLERFWSSELRRQWRPFEGRVQVTFLEDLSFDEMLRRTANLPPDSAIFFALMILDAAGVPHEQEMAVERLHSAANAPIFGWSDNLLGHGIVGGPLIPLGDLGKEAARAGLRILSGESPAEIRSPVVGAYRPAYDWRELRRWGIDKDLLPPNHAILFQPPSILRTYGWPILAALALILVQALAITGLLVARHRRWQAEEETLRLRRELAHAGRVSVVGQLASSLAHELNQPLGAILRNAEAAELILDSSQPNLAEVRAILSDIRKDDHRAGSVIDGIRGLLRRHDMEMKPVHLEAIVEAVVDLVRPDAQSRGVTFAIDMPSDLPMVRGNTVQLQQVLLNLMINGMDAVSASSDGRRLSVRGRPLEGGQVEIAIRDSGPGIPPEELPRIFENFYTTKPGGMGMGLSICRRIVEAHGGEIRAENDASGGATVRLTLPSAGGEA